MDLSELETQLSELLETNKVISENSESHPLMYILNDILQLIMSCIHLYKTKN